MRSALTPLRVALKKVEIMQTIVNKVQLIGRIGMNPEIKTLANGSKMLRMSIATDASYKDADGKKVQDTQWHTLVAWNKTAELAEKLCTKGKQIAVEGALVNRQWDDKDGTKRYATEVRLESFLLLGKKED